MIDKLRRQILKSFAGIHFEPVHHVYTVNEKHLTPVTTLGKRFATEFPVEQKAIESAMKYGGTPEEYKEAWAASGKAACDLGTRVHAFGERYFYDKKLKPQDGYEKAIVAFWKSIPSHILPLLAESRIFTENYQYAGTLDNLFYDMKQKGVVITDYKTNKDIHKNFQGQRLLYPFNFLLDTPFNKYQVQVSLYQIPFEDIGVKVLERRIIWLKADGTFENLKTTDYTQVLRATLN